MIDIFHEYNIIINTHILIIAGLMLHLLLSLIRSEKKHRVYSDLCGLRKRNYLRCYAVRELIEAMIMISLNSARIPF